MAAFDVAELHQAMIEKDDELRPDLVIVYSSTSPNTLSTSLACRK